jgi:hypothetical protein
MLKIASVTQDADSTDTQYDCDFIVECAGDSLWGDTNGRKVHVTGISVFEDAEGFKSITVAHDSEWDIYTDTGFEAAISEALGYEVCFTEQGMQEDGLASME